MARRTGDRERKEGGPFDWRWHKVWGDGGEQVKEKGNKRAGRREETENW